MERSQTDHVQRVTKNRKSPYLVSVAACDYKYNAIKIDIKKLGAPSLSQSVVGSRRRKSVVVSFFPVKTNAIGVLAVTITGSDHL